MGLTRIALKIAAPAPKIEQYERYLFIGPHPDDIEIGAGATAAKLAAAGKEICFLVCLDGRFGDGNTPVQALAYYMTAKPNRYVKTYGYMGRQMDAVFGTHLSQFPEGCTDRDTICLYLKLRAVDFGIRSLTGCAEGFRVLGTTHMQCLPEAGE